MSKSLKTSLTQNTVTFRTIKFLLPIFLGAARIQVNQRNIYKKADKHQVREFLESQVHDLQEFEKF